MTRVWSSVALIAAIAVAAGCGSADEIRPAPEAFDLDAELWSRYGDLGPDLYYFDGLADLDDDGDFELIVHVVSPMLCGTGGCTTLVFSPTATGAELVGDITVTRPPIRVSPRRSHGWRNLIVRVAGGGVESHDAELAFDGATYPSNPTVPPAVVVTDLAGSEVVIPEFSDLTEGTRVVAP